jgi:hypothetical protein
MAVYNMVHHHVGVAYQEASFLMGRGVSESSFPARSSSTSQYPALIGVSVVRQWALQGRDEPEEGSSEPLLATAVLALAV